MSLTCLKAEHFRNLNYPDLNFHAQFNLFYGVNGSGKTSLLEAIHFLCLARSFRSHQVARIIYEEADSFTLFGSISDEKQTIIPAGIEKHRQGETRIKINGEAIRSVAELASLQPLQMIQPATFHLIDAGPQYRRQFLDWGVFHVEPSFFSLWKRVETALKQRNSALRQHAPQSQVQAWDQELVTAGEALDVLRRSYFSTFVPAFSEILAQLMNRDDLTINYYSGWNEELSLQMALDRSFERDRSVGYTQSGPQRADITLKVHDMPAGDILSRGEQKLVICALRLAQGIHLQRLTGKSCIYLIDDLMSELDSQNRDTLLLALQKTQAQVFITALTPDGIGDFMSEGLGQMFHVEQGRISENVPPFAKGGQRA